MVCFVRTLLCFFFLILTNASSQPSKPPKIVIVGAGLSGLSAAVKLVENGFENILIFEAEDRIGGRIHSVPFANGKIDFGAQWVHGETNNVVYDLMHNKFEFGDTGIQNTAPLFLSLNENSLNQEQCRVLKESFEMILESYEEMRNFNGTLGDFMIKKVGQKLETEAYNPPDLPLQMLDLMEKEVNVWNGTSSWFDISAKLNTFSDVNTGNQYLTWSDKGFSVILDYLLKKLPDPSKQINIDGKILLGEKVVNIQTEMKPFFPKTKVVLESGEQISADHVIFTSSLGVLKNSHKTLFTPKLPQWKVNAIDNMGFGTLEKIFLEFEKPFWPTDKRVWVSYDFLWSRDEVEELKRTEKEWVVDIRSFTRVDAMPNVIEAILAGKHMFEFELFEDNKIIDDSMWLLEKFLRKSLPKPINMKRTKWLTNPNFCGTFSYQSHLADINNVLPMDLAKSITNSGEKPFILFAGEATDDRFPSNAHGAILSGWRAADEIISFHSRKKFT